MSNEQIVEVLRTLRDYTLTFKQREALAWCQAKLLLLQRDTS